MLSLEGEAGYQGTVFSFAPPGLAEFPQTLPTACAVACVLSPLRGWTSDFVGVTNAWGASGCELSVLLPGASLEGMASIASNPAQKNSAFAGMHTGMAEVWIKFLLALVGLGIAFAAALFSTTSGEAGKLWTSVILASLALLMAVFVGLVTVPYLARRVAIERLRESFHYDVNRAGVIYVLVTLVIGIAALNTGNNLLYIVVAAMLAAILVSGIVSAVVLRRLELDVRLPQHAFAGQTAVARVELHNPRRVLPSFSIRVVPPRSEKKTTKQWKLERTTFAFPPNLPPQSQWLRLRDWRMRRVPMPTATPGIFEGIVYFPYLPAGSSLTAEVELCFARRGSYRESSFGLATRFPFAFLTKRRDVRLEREILVYPAVEPTDELLDILPLVRGEWQSFMRGRGSDLYRIREYMPDDSARHVDWKATAKSGSLKVREFTREDERKLRIVFDNPAAGVISERGYERAVNLAASLAWHFSSQEAEVSFAISGANATHGIHEFLGKLAVIEPGLSAGYSADAEAGSGAFADFGSGSRSEFNIVLTARPRGSVPTRLWSCSYFIFLNSL